MRRMFLLLSTVLVAACTNVQPWERGYLARPEMAFDPNPGAAAQLQHMYASKEAASGGPSVGGGGCGCN